SALRPVRQPLEVSRAERGLVGVAIKVLDFFDVDLVGRSAMALARTFEEEQLGREPGLYRCSLAAPSKDGVPDLDPVAEGVLSASDDRPALLFLHGTASSVGGADGGLWRASNQEGALARRRLEALYGDRVYAFEHRSLTSSP